jgi:putative tryptophan/tyrosine transport system substrate-binding protein
MHNTLLKRFLNSLSDNRKSKIQNRKLVGIITLAIILTTDGAVAQAQQTASKIPRIGYLALSRSAGTEAFLQGLKDLGYVEGQNITVERRSAEGKEDRLADLAAELLQLKVDVIVVGGTAAARAVRRLTKTIPIVIPDSADPVAGELVASLSRPGGNITGLTTMSAKLSGKRLELLKETFSTISSVGVLVRCGEQCRFVPPGGILRGQDPERRESSRSAGRAADEI